MPTGDVLPDWRPGNGADRALVWRLKTKFGLNRRL